MCCDTPAKILKKLTDLSETGVPLHPFAVAHNLRPPQVNALIASLQLRLVGSAAEERVFCERRWQELLHHIEKIIVQFHRSNPSLVGASIKDIQTQLIPFVEMVTLEAALNLLVAENSLVRREKILFALSRYSYLGEGHEPFGSR